LLAFPNLGSAQERNFTYDDDGDFLIRLSENAHKIKNQAYNQNHTNAPAAISWAAKVESASAKQEN
jgi:hypothetical protein